MSTMRRPWANHATGMSVPLTRSHGWWQPRELRLRLAVDARDLEAREGNRPPLVRDVHEPQERRGAGLELGHVLVGHDEEPPAVEGKRQGRAVCVGVMKGGLQSSPDRSRGRAHVLDVEDDEIPRASS